MYDNKKTLFLKLKNKSKKEWENYTKHKFLIDLVSNKLPLIKFKKYLLQDYIFLQQFLRILSLSCYKAKNLSDISRSAGFITAIQHELKLHITFCKKWGITMRDLRKTKPLKPNSNYTNYVLSVGKVESNLDLFVCLAPCIIGYGEIGMNLSKNKFWKKSKYKQWIEMYSSKDYQKTASENIDYLDLLYKRKKNKNINKLSKFFKKATILEKKFWDMMYKM